MQALLCYQKKKSVSTCLMIDATSETSVEKSELVVCSVSSQAGPSFFLSRKVSVGTVPITFLSVSTQTEKVLLTRVSSSVELIPRQEVLLPDTPSTVDCGFDLMSLRKGEDSQFADDMDSFLKCAMTRVLTDSSSDEEEWLINRLATMDSSTTTGTVVGGGVYRTISAPVQESFYPPLDECFTSEEATTSDLFSTIEYTLESKIRPKNLLDIGSLVARMTRVLEQGLVDTTNTAERVSLIPFGGFASGLQTSVSSVDLMLIIPLSMFESQFGSLTVSSPNSRNEFPKNQIKEFETRTAMRKALSRCAELLIAGCGLSLVKLTSAGTMANSRIPSVSLVDLSTGARFEIMCNSLFPLFSTRLLKTYTENNMRELGDLILLVKYWGAKKRLVSSFSLSLMCVFYCQVQLQVFSSIQTGDRKQWKDPFGSRRCDVSFAETLPTCEWGGVSAAALFVGFIDFYANYWNWANGVVSVRLGRIVGVDSGEMLIKQLGNNGYKLYIEDPFDTKRDIGISGSAAEELRNEFTSTNWQLANATEPTLFESITDFDKVNTYNKPQMRRSGSCI